MSQQYKDFRRNMGSVSSGTMRPEDLIPVFLDELESQKPLLRSDHKLITEMRKFMTKCNCDVPCRGRQAKSDNESVHLTQYFESEHVSEDLDELFDRLNHYTLPGFYFGAHPGDGADYGYWLDESFIEDFDGLKVDDLSEVPFKYRGEVLHVNDHGNVSLYYHTRGNFTEIWAIV